MRLLRSSLPALALALAACGSPEPAARCVPGATQACPCPDGPSGAQTCRDDGTFDPCQCRPGAAEGPPPEGAPSPSPTPPSEGEGEGEDTTAILITFRDGEGQDAPVRTAWFQDGEEVARRSGLAAAVDGDLVVARPEGVATVPASDDACPGASRRRVTWAFERADGRASLTFDGRRGDPPGSLTVTPVGVLGPYAFLHVREGGTLCEGGNSASDTARVALVDLRTGERVPDLRPSPPLPEAASVLERAQSYHPGATLDPATVRLVAYFPVWNMASGLEVQAMYAFAVPAASRAEMTVSDWLGEGMADIQLPPRTVPPPLAEALAALPEDDAVSGFALADDFTHQVLGYGRLAGDLGADRARFDALPAP